MLQTDEVNRTVDLHLHSSCSDGLCTPLELVTMARNVGLCAIALCDHDSVAAGVEARRRYQDAFYAVGIIGCSWLLPVVLCGWSVADLVKKRGGNAMTVQGRVMAALDRLAEHFGLGESRATVVLEAPWMLTPYVPVGQALPAERIGRGRR